MDRTHDEIRAEYVGSMGPDLGQLYHELEDDVSWLHDKWSEMKELFGKGPVRIDLLNEVASSIVSRKYVHIVFGVFPRWNRRWPSTGTAVPWYCNGARRGRCWPPDRKST